MSSRTLYIHLRNIGHKERSKSTLMSKKVESACVARYDKEHGIRCGVPGKNWNSESNILTLNQKVLRQEKGLCDNCASFRNAKKYAAKAKII
jgi:hypothetical protein